MTKYTTGTREDRLAARRERISSFPNGAVTELTTVSGPAAAWSGTMKGELPDVPGMSQ
jgi:hypothetical protein